MPAAINADSHVLATTSQTQSLDASLCQCIEFSRKSNDSAQLPFVSLESDFCISRRMVESVQNNSSNVLDAPSESHQSCWFLIAHSIRRLAPVASGAAWILSLMMTQQPKSYSLAAEHTPVSPGVWSQSSQIQFKSSSTASIESYPKLSTS